MQTYVCIIRSILFYCVLTTAASCDKKRTYDEFIFFLSKINFSLINELPEQSDKF